MEKVENLDPQKLVEAMELAAGEDLDDDVDLVVDNADHEEPTERQQREQCTFGFGAHTNLGTGQQPFSAPSPPSYL